MFIEFIVNVLHIDLHIDDGRMDAGDSALRGHDRVADGILVAMENR